MSYALISAISLFLEDPIVYPKRAIFKSPCSQHTLLSYRQTSLSCSRSSVEGKQDDH